MNFELLADRPEAINVVAGWYYDEWGRANPNSSVARIAGNLARSMNRDRPPLVLLAVKNDNVVAAAELKYREMEIYPDKEHWLGGMFVLPALRGAGVASQLIERVVALAKGFGISTLYLQTERLDGGLYTRHGWQPLDTVNNKGTRVLVMQKPVGT